MSTVKRRDRTSLSFPAASTALTKKVWVPSWSGDPRVNGEEHGKKVWPVKWHSKVDPSSFVAKPKYRNRFQAGYGVAKLNASKRWKAYGVGSSGVGCPGGKGVVPKLVRKDLKLHCP